MSQLRPEKLHVRFASGSQPGGPAVPRRYTLTHSDLTGDLFLTMAPDYNQEQLSGFQMRLMHDEVLGEWLQEGDSFALHLYCHVSGGLIFGPARLRDFFFRRELPLALQALRYGDRALFQAHPVLDQAPVWVHFRAAQARYNRVERWGVPADYRRHAAST